jgi:hypothetical protein
MNPIAIVAAVSAALNLVEQLLPTVRELFAAGEISIEQQAELLARNQK